MKLLDGETPLRIASHIFFRKRNQTMAVRILKTIDFLNATSRLKTCCFVCYFLASRKNHKASSRQYNIKMARHWTSLAQERSTSFNYNSQKWFLLFTTKIWYSKILSLKSYPEYVCLLVVECDTNTDASIYHCLRSITHWIPFRQFSVLKYICLNCTWCFNNYYGNCFWENWDDVIRIHKISRLFFLLKNYLFRSLQLYPYLDGIFQTPVMKVLNNSQ